jgi:CIC family chloride channel protein
LFFRPNMTAYVLAHHRRPVPIYEALLVQDGVHLPHRRGAVSHALEQLRVAEAMTTRPVTLPADLTIAEALRRVGNYDFSTYPVIGDAGRFTGMVSEARLRRTMAEGERHQTVGQIADKGDYVFPDQPLVRAVVHMNRSKVRQLAVLERGDGKGLVGLLTMSDIVSAQARAALAAGEADKTMVPEFNSLEEPIN